MRPGRHMKHTDLFLVRVWTQEVRISYGTDGNTGGDEPAIEWRGRIQRVVDGEAREFKDWEAFVDGLRAMMSAASPRPRREEGSAFLGPQ